MSSTTRMMVGVDAPMTRIFSDTRTPGFFQQQDVIRRPFEKIVAAMQIERGVQPLVDLRCHGPELEERAASRQQPRELPPQPRLAHEIGTAGGLKADLPAMHERLRHELLEDAFDHGLVDPT